MSKGARRLALFAALAAASLYTLALAFLYFQQRAFLYFPDPQILTPASQGVPQARDVRIDTRDGEHLRGWWIAPRQGQPIILLFEGNGMRLDEANMAPRFNAITSKGVGMLALAYRGYSGSTGHPTEDGLHEDARAAYAWLIAHGAAPRDIVIEGHSIGSGVAVRLAAERQVRALILESPYTATVDVARERFPWAPVDILMRDQFRSRDWIGKVHAPILVVHGDQDNQIPFAQGKRLFALAREPKTFVRMSAGHNDLVAAGLYDHIWPFLQSLPAEP